MISMKTTDLRKEDQPQRGLDPPEMMVASSLLDGGVYV